MFKELQNFFFPFKFFNEVFFYFLRFYLFIFRERGREAEREEEKHQCVVASCAPPTGDVPCNPGMCPDWDSKQGPFGYQAGAQSTELHQPGSEFFSKRPNHLTFPPAMYKVSNFSTFSSTLVIFCLLDSSHPTGYEWYLTVVLVFISLISNDNKNLFLCTDWSFVYPL